MRCAACGQHHPHGDQIADDIWKSIQQRQLKRFHQRIFNSRQLNELAVRGITTVRQAMWVDLAKIPYIRAKSVDRFYEILQEQYEFELQMFGLVEPDIRIQK